MPDSLRDTVAAATPDRPQLRHRDSRGRACLSHDGCGTRVGVSVRHSWLSGLGVLLLLLAIGGRADGQSLPGVPAAQPPPVASATRPELPPDALGRSTPRGTVLGFLAAARRGDETLARQYLNVRGGAGNADDLARQLFAVLDARLPARLTQLSESPDGSRLNP